MPRRQSPRPCRYLSLFSGIGGFEVALHSLVPHAECVGFSEINPKSIEVYQRHFPNHPALGDVCNIDVKSIPRNIDIVLAGFPCTDLSIARENRQGLDGQKSGLFWTTLNIIRKVKPRFFVVENVHSMAAKERDVISRELGVEPVMIDARTFTNQSRKRLFWTNLPGKLTAVDTVPEDDGSTFERHLIPLSETHNLHISQRKLDSMDKETNGGRTRWDFGRHSDTANANSACLTAGMHKLNCNCILIDRRRRRRAGKLLIRKFHPLEVERLQGFPDNWTDGVATTHRLKALGNAVNASVATHLLRELSDVFA